LLQGAGPGLTDEYSFYHANLHTHPARFFIVICKIALLAFLLNLMECGSNGRLNEQE
jgi:hypothetical protein